MYMQLRDHTGKMHRIAAEGAVFGRDRTRCDVVLPDIGVSGVHAKVYCRQGHWMLEDLHSSNGTFIGETRVTTPVELARGITFGLFRWRFEVIDISVTGGLEPDFTEQSDNEKTGPLRLIPSKDSALGDPSADTSSSEPLSTHADSRELGVASHSSVHSEQPAALSASSSVAASSRQAGTTIPFSGNSASVTLSPDNVQWSAALEDSSLQQKDKDKDKEVEAEEEVETVDGVSWSLKKSIEQFRLPRFLSQCKQALAYYPKTMFSLIVKPRQTIQESINNTSQPSKLSVDLAAYAFTAMIIGSVAMLTSNLVFSAVSGRIAFVNQVIVLPLITIAVAIVSSAIAGIFWHPFLTWLIGKLGGHSSAMQRSNMFALLYAAICIFSIVSAISVFFVLVPLPFMAIVASVVSLAAIFLLYVVMFLWFRHLSVVRWFLVVVIVLGALSAVNSARALFVSSQAVVAHIRSGMASKAVASKVVVSTNTSPPVARTELVVNKTNSSSSAEASSGHGVKEPARASSGVINMISSSTTSGAADKANTGQGSSGTSLAAVTVGSAPSSNTTHPAPVNTSQTTVLAPAKGVKTTYPQFVVQRDAIEKTIETDPTLLTRIPGLLDLYRKLHTETDRVEAKHAEKGKKAPEDIVEKRLRDADVYEATSGIVNEIARILIQANHQQ